MLAAPATALRAGKEDAMRVLVTTVAPGLDAEIEPRFWHAAYLTIVDTNTLQWEAVPAPGAPSVHAAGTRLGLLATHRTYAPPSATTTARTATLCSNRPAS